MTEAKKSFKLDIFKLLGRLDKGDYHVWEKLSDEERKGFSSLVTMRWMSGTSDARQVVFLNELVNPMIFNLSDHPELQMKLLAIASSKQNKRYKWLSMKTTRKVKPKILNVIKEYLEYSSKDAEEASVLISNEDIISMAEELGYQPDEIKNIKKELK